MEATKITLIRSSKGWRDLGLPDLWVYRELLYFLAWRDVKVRYKQTLLGVLWVVLQPLVSMAIFTVLFGILLQVDSGDVPYPVFAFAGLLPWNYFSQALTRSSTSVVNSAHLVTKIDFPRVVLTVLMLFCGIVPTIAGLLMRLQLVFMKVEEVS